MPRDFILTTEDRDTRREEQKRHFLDHIVVNPRPTVLVRMLLASLDDGLRGLWLPADDDTGCKHVWWEARYGTHGDAYNRLSLPSELFRKCDIELHCDWGRGSEAQTGEIFLSWRGNDEMGEAIMAHPTLKSSLSTGTMQFGSRRPVIKDGHLEYIPTPAGD